MDGTFQDRANSCSKRPQHSCAIQVINAVALDSDHRTYDMAWFSPQRHKTSAIF